MLARPVPDRIPDSLCVVIRARGQDHLQIPSSGLRKSSRAPVKNANFCFHSDDLLDKTPEAYELRNDLRLDHDYVLE